MSSKYVCTLDDASLKKAREELNEIPSDRMAAIQALRDWVQQQPHFILPDFEDWELLMYLRGAKFSQLRAREMIDGGLTLRGELKHWMCDVDSRDEKVQTILREGYSIPLPKRTSTGCQVVLYRLGTLDPDLKRYSKADTVKAAIVVGTYLLRSEMTQVNGSVLIFDFSGFSAKHVKSQMSEQSDMKKFHKLWQDNSPGRMKQFNYYKTGLFLETLMGFVKLFLKKKFQDRIIVHDNLETLYKRVPMELLPEEYLPDDYRGPTVGSLDELKDKFIAEVSTDAFRDNLLYRTSSKWGVDENKRPKKEAVVTQTFRKLNVE